METLVNNNISALLLATALALSAGSAAFAQDKALDKTVKIGALSDLSGLYADLGGRGSALAARQEHLSVAEEVISGARWQSTVGRLF
jgi:hypothetical protein